MIGQKTYIAEVMPLARTRGQDTLSYFSTAKIRPGTMVKAPLRKSFAIGIVSSCIDAKSVKSGIRRADFSLRKIKASDILNAFLPESFLKAVSKTARYYAVKESLLLTALLPKIAEDKPEAFFRPDSKNYSKLRGREAMLFQMETDERYGQYRALVRQNFARNSSVIFIVPTRSDLARAKDELSRGIEEFVYVFDLEKKKEAEASWQEARNSKHPVLFISTPSGLSFSRKDLDAIILERENSRVYRTIGSPHFHYRKFAENLAQASGAQLIMGDSVLSLETLWREKRGDFGENALIRWRLPAVPTKLADASSKQSPDGNFEIFSKELKEMLERAVSEKEKVFLFGARKGLAPTTVCGDCGTVLPCLNCGAPVVLHKKGGENVYVCHACRDMRDSATSCGYCHSWKLIPLGIGTEQIAKALTELFPKTPIYILDKDHAGTSAKAKSIVKKFNETGGIMVGTELAFFHAGRVPYSGLVSADSLFSIPDWNIHERVFYLISYLREMAQKEALIQTRNIGRQILSWASQGNIIDFYLSEIEEREKFSYPPFSIFIKISAPQDPKGLEALKQELSKWHPDAIKDSIVMRIAHDVWPDEELSRKLSLLPRSFAVKVDPESIMQ